MSVLGIDYGRVRLGLAIADGPLAKPLTTLSASHRERLIKEISQIIQTNAVGQIVIGVSENQMGQESQRFAQLLRDSVQLPVIEVDETLTTVEAQARLVAGGKTRANRRKFIDAAAAALILQSWLDRT